MALQNDIALFRKSAQVRFVPDLNLISRKSSFFQHAERIRGEVKRARFARGVEKSAWSEWRETESEGLGDRPESEEANCLAA